MNIKFDLINTDMCKLVVCITYTLSVIALMKSSSYNKNI